MATILDCKDIGISITTETIEIFIWQYYFTCHKADPNVIFCSYPRIFHPNSFAHDLTFTGNAYPQSLHAQTFLSL